MQRCLVAICTRNRAASLQAVLDALSAQEGGLRSSWSILVVDNGSTDETLAVCRAYSGRILLRVVSEDRAGLSCARNRALGEPDWDCLVFTDDDVVLPTRWVEAWDRAFTAHADSGWFGGPVKPVWAHGKPRWVHADTPEILEGALVHHDLGAQPRLYRPEDGFPIGANFGFRRGAAERVGPFREDLGHVGGELGRGEETEWLGRAAALGIPGRFVPQARLGHPVPPDRLKLGFYWRLGAASGRACARMGTAVQAGGRLRQLTQLLRGLRQSLRGRGDRFRQCVFNAGFESGLRCERKARALREAERESLQRKGTS